MSDTAFLAALVHAENAWLAVLAEAGFTEAADLTGVVGPGDLADIAVRAERDGNPVTALVAVLRSRLDGDVARWLHRGLTSQDVLDTALVLCLRDVRSALERALDEQVRVLVELVETHRAAPMLTHTLTQPALPGTAGRFFAGWLTAVLDAAEALHALPALPVASGGAAGTYAATTELTGSASAALRLAANWADRLGLEPALPWHTTRSTVTRFGDALVGCCDAWGHIANDVSIRGRAGELAEGSGGGSSTMPHKNNPVLTVLLRRAALTAPGLGATLHAAAAAQVDERADGGWHAEWETLRLLARRTVVAAGQATELLTGLRVDTAQAAANLAAAQGIYAEQKTTSTLVGRTPAASYLGASDLLVDSIIQRANDFQKESR